MQLIKDKWLEGYWNCVVSNQKSLITLDFPVEVCTGYLWSIALLRDHFRCQHWKWWATVMEYGLYPHSSCEYCNM